MKKSILFSVLIFSTFSFAEVAGVICGDLGDTPSEAAYKLNRNVIHNPKLILDSKRGSEVLGNATMQSFQIVPLENNKFQACALMKNN